MDNYVLIDQTNMIINVIAWDGSSPYPTPPNTQLVKFNGPAGVGWAWDGVQAVDPRPTPVVTPPPSVIDPIYAYLKTIQPLIAGAPPAPLKP
jgi:hypothetical protein